MLYFCPICDPQPHRGKRSDVLYVINTVKDGGIYGGTRLTFRTRLAEPIIDNLKHWWYSR